MSASLVATALIVVIISLIAFILNLLIYKKTTGGSNAYLYWAIAATFTLSGSILGLISSFFMDPNQVELEGIEAFIAVIQLSLYLTGYYYIAFAATYLPAQLNIINIDLEKFYNFRKIVFVGILVWGVFVSSLIVVISGGIPVRMFYVPFYAISWLFAFRNIVPFYKQIRNSAGYWLYLVLAFLFGFLANLSEVIAFFLIDGFIILKPLFFIPMGIFLILGFYKLGRDLEAY